MFQGFAYAYAYLVALLLAVALVAALLGFFVGRAPGARRERRLRAKLAESLLSPTPLDSEQYYLEAGDTSGTPDAAWAAAWDSDWGSTPRSPVESEASSPSAATAPETDEEVPKSWETPDIAYSQTGSEPSFPGEEQEGVPAWLTESVAAETDVSDPEPIGEASVPSSPTLESNTPDADSVVPVPHAEASGALIDSPNIWPAMASSDSVDLSAEAAPDSASPVSPSHEWDVEAVKGSAADTDVPLTTDSAKKQEPASDFEATEVLEGTESGAGDESEKVGFGASEATFEAVFEETSQDSEADGGIPVPESEAATEQAEVVAQDLEQDDGLEPEPEADSEPPVGRARTYSVSPEGSVEVSDEQAEDKEKDSREASAPTDEQDFEEVTEADAVAELERLRTEMYRLETGAVSAWDRVVPQLEERIGELERDNNRLANELRAIEGQMMLQAGQRNRPGSDG